MSDSTINNENPDAPRPPTKRTRKSRLSPPQDEGLSATSAPLTDDGSNSAASPRPTELAYLDLGASLAIAAAEAGRTGDPASETPAEVEKAEGRSDSDRLVLPDSVVPPVAEPVRSVEALADAYRQVSEQPVWTRVALVAECRIAHGEISLSRLAALSQVPRTRIIEDNTLSLFKNPDDRVIGASPSSHLFAIRLATRRSGETASPETVRSLARVILMETPQITKLQTLIKNERKGGSEVPPVGEMNGEKDAAGDDAEKNDGTAVYEAILESIDEIEAFLSSGSETQVQSVIAAIEGLLAQAKAPKVRTFVPVANDAAVGAA